MNIDKMISDIQNNSINFDLFNAYEQKWLYNLFQNGLSLQLCPLSEFNQDIQMLMCYTAYLNDINSQYYIPICIRQKLNNYLNK